MKSRNIGKNVEYRIRCQLSAQQAEVLRDHADRLDISQAALVRLLLNKLPDVDLRNAPGIEIDRHQVPQSNNFPVPDALHDELVAYLEHWNAQPGSKSRLTKVKVIRAQIHRLSIGRIKLRGY